MQLIKTGMCVAAALMLGSAAKAGSDAAAGRAVLEATAKAYASAPTLADSMVLRFGAEAYEMSMRFDRDNVRSYFALPDVTIITIEKTLYMIHDASPDKYLEREIDDTISSTLISLTHDPSSVPFHFLIREGRDVDTWLRSIAFGMFQQPEITGVETLRKDDVTYQIVHVKDRAGTLQISIEEATKKIDHVRVEIEPMPGMMDDESMVAQMQFSPSFAESLTEPIEFDKTGRTMVRTIEDLMPDPLAVGDEAPTFTLETLDGEKVSLEALRGSVVVLDFWATWCQPCIQALPELDSFAAWAKEEGHPVHVYAINVLEHRARSRDDRSEMIGEFWRGRKFGFETLMDYQDEVAAKYGINSLPMTFIIGPDGRISNIHMGYMRGLKETLKREVREVLPTPG